MHAELKFLMIKMSQPLSQELFCIDTLNATRAVVAFSRC